MTILDNTIKALKNPGGKASYSDIYAEYEKVVGNTITKKPTSWNKSLY